MAVATKALAYTPQLMVRSLERPEEPVPFASGLFVKWNRRSFLLTAGHCIQDGKGNVNKIGLMIDRHFYAISGHSWVHADPKIDLGFVLLTEQSEKICADAYPFLEEHMIQPNYFIKDSDNYLVAGYPVSKTDVNMVGRKISKEPFVLHTVPKSPSFYQKNGFAPEQSILTSFHRRKSRFYGEEGYQKSPEPYGISGSGLWCIPSFVTASPEDATFYLVAVMTEYHPQQSFFHATHIREAIKIMTTLTQIQAPEP